MKFEKTGEVPEALQVENMETPPYQLSTGALRSEQAPAYHLIPREGLRRLAGRYALGAEKYGDNNWKTGIETEAGARVNCVEAYNHLIEHASKMVNGIDPDDDHLAAIAWAAFVIAEAEAVHGKRWTEFSTEEFEPEQN